MLQSTYSGKGIVEELREEQVELGVAMARQMHEASPFYRNFPFSEAVFRGWLMASIKEPNRIFCRFVWRGEEICGGMLGAAANMLFSETKMAMELALYVQPQFRGGRTGILLVKAFEKWAKEQNCGLMTVGVSAGITDNRAIEFYKRLGFEQHGVSLRREIR